MMIIQILLIIAGLSALKKLISDRATHAMRAWKKLGFLCLITAMIVAVLFPDLVTRTANLLGVGRGSDLLIYLLFVAFLFYVLGQYVRSQDERDRVFRLARRIVLVEAKHKYRLPRSQNDNYKDR